MARRQKHSLETMYDEILPKREHVFNSFTGKPRLQDARGALGNDNLLMGRDMIAVRVRDKCKGLRIPRIEPQILPGQIDTPLIPNFNHEKIYPTCEPGATHIDMPPSSPFY